MAKITLNINNISYNLQNSLFDLPTVSTDRTDRAIVHKIAHVNGCCHGGRIRRI